MQEGTVIADLHREKKTLREIAAVTRRSPSTVSRELGRNTGPDGRYLPGMADRLAAGRVARPRPRRLSVDEELHTVVVELLGKRWSPEQVAHERRQRFTHQPERQLCTKSIYQAIYATDVDLTRPAKCRRRASPAPRSGT